MSAPILDIPSTPANEWAASTTNAITSADGKSFPAAGTEQVEQPEERHPAIPHFASTSSTPGPSFPGSFPKESEDLQGSSSGPDISLDQAKQTVVDNVTGIFETAKQYLPEAVTSYFPSTASNTQGNDASNILKTTSLPSSEVHGDTSGKSGGVGSLPGNVNEEAVAKLPEERAIDKTIGETTEVGSENQHPIQSTTNTLANPTLPNDLLHPSGQTGSTSSQTYHKSDETVTTAEHTNTAPGNDMKEKETSSSVPEIETAANVVGGVGDLPGSTSESAVALLPEERQAHVEQTSSSTSPSAVISDSKRADVTPQATMDSQTSTNSKVNTASRAPDSLFSTTAVAGHTPLDTPLSDTTSGPHAGDLKTDQESITTATTHSAHTAAPTSADIIHTKSATDTASEPGSIGSSSRKSGFMTKLKGEAKVLSGKIGRNEEKIEEGKRMLGKV